MAEVTMLKVRVGTDAAAITVKGRMAWALHQLIQSGERGCTPIERPAPRWSDYIFKLRKAGLAIDTIDESHGGAYSGSHGRYVLKTAIEVLEVARQ